MKAFFRRIWNFLKGDSIDEVLLPFAIGGAAGIIPVWIWLSQSVSTTFWIFLLVLAVVTVFIGVKSLLRIIDLQSLRRQVEWRDRILDQEKQNLTENLERALNACEEAQNLCLEWKRYAEGIEEKYFGEVNSVLAVVSSHSEVLPQQQAILSNLSNNAVSASAMKSFVDFSSKIDNKTSVVLVRVHHNKAIWHVDVTGHSIELEQALHIMDGVKRKLRDFAGKNSLVKITEKISN